VFGSRLAVRLVLFFALVAVLPGALVYAVSVQFLGKSIESWFDVRVDRALEGGLNLGRNALDYLLKDTANKASQIAVTLGEAAPGSLSARLNRAAEQAGVYEATLYSSTGSVLAVAGHRQLDRAPGNAARTGAAARAAPADVHGDRAARRRRARAARRDGRSTATTGSSRSRCCN
jgi:nitrogen fixation/metabolism regulation signal transduction histidine kinase